VSTRFRFGPEFKHAVQIRGLTLSDVARRAGVALATACAAARGDAVNVSSAIRLSKAVAENPVLPELEAWVSPPGAPTVTKHDVEEQLQPTKAAQVSERRRVRDQAGPGKASTR
jgi:hypothetical protein